MTLIARILTEDYIIPNICISGSFKLESDNITIYLPVWRLGIQIRVDVENKPFKVDCNNLRYLFGVNGSYYRVVSIHDPEQRYITFAATKTGWSVNTSNHISFEVEKCLDLV